MSNPEQPVDFLVPVLGPNGTEYSDRHSMRIQREHVQVILVSIPALVNHLSNYRGSQKRGLRILRSEIILTYNSQQLEVAMHTTNLRKVGGSIMLAVPPALLDILRLRPGARVGIAVESGRLVVEPQKRPRYTLEELLAQCHPKAGRTKEEREWLDDKPIGGELI